MNNKFLDIDVNFAIRIHVTGRRVANLDVDIAGIHVIFVVK